MDDDPVGMTPSALGTRSITCPIARSWPSRSASTAPGTIWSGSRASSSHTQM